MFSINMDGDDGNSNGVLTPNLGNEGRQIDITFSEVNNLQAKCEEAFLSKSQSEATKVDHS